jgi:hypothetical protein
LLGKGDRRARATELLEKLKERRPDDTLVLVNLHRASPDGGRHRPRDRDCSSRRAEIDPLSDIVHLCTSPARIATKARMAGEVPDPTRCSLLALESIQRGLRAQPLRTPPRTGCAATCFFTMKHAAPRRANAWMQAAKLDPQSVMVAGEGGTVPVPERIAGARPCRSCASSTCSSPARRGTRALPRGGARETSGYVAPRRGEPPRAWPTKIDRAPGAIATFHPEGSSSRTSTPLRSAEFRFTSVEAARRPPPDGTIDGAGGGGMKSRRAGALAPDRAPASMSLIGGCGERAKLDGNRGERRALVAARWRASRAWTSCTSAGTPAASI